MNKKIMTMIVLIITVGSISITYAYDHSSFFGEDCNVFTSQFNQKTCNDVNDLNDRLIISENEQSVMNTTINNLTVRINELTLLHYPEDVTPPISPPVPEIVPLPEYPIEGPTPELAPEIPIIRAQTYADDVFVVIWEPESFDPRFEEPASYVVETSVDGIEWTSYNVPVGDNHFYVTSENYVETLVRVKAINEFGESNWSLISSSITTVFWDENADISYIDYNGINLSFSWYNWGSFSHDVLGWKLERSINYGQFEIIDELHQNTSYSTEVTETDKIYSYRVSLVTDFETQPRSGFGSIQIP